MPVLRYVPATGLFTIPDLLLPFTAADEVVPTANTAGEGSGEASEEQEVDPKSKLGGWRLALEAPFDQIEKYDRYVRGVSQFDTHQGKGFPRVMVIVSDEQARGFMFACDKLFGAKDKSKTDLENEAAGKETTIDRTRRLFYVTCSRSKKTRGSVAAIVNGRLQRAGSSRFCSVPGMDIGRV